MKRRGGRQNYIADGERPGCSDLMGLLRHSLTLIKGFVPYATLWADTELSQ